MLLAGSVVGLVACVALFPVGFGIMIGVGLAVAASGMISMATAIRAGARDRKMVKRIEQITELLKQYSQLGKNVQDELGKMGGAKKAMKLRAQKAIDTDAWLRIRTHLAKITAHLDDYELHGNKTMEAIEEACQEFIKM